MHTTVLDNRKGLGAALAAFAVSALVLAGCGAAQASSPAAPTSSAVTRGAPSAAPTTPTAAATRAAAAPTGVTAPTPAPAATQNQASKAPPAASPSPASPASPSPTPGPVPAATSSSQGAGGVGPATLDSAPRRNQAGNVTLEATWQSQAGAAGQLAFSVVMDTHSVDLDGVDLGRLSALRNDRGLEVRPERWEAPPGGHHRSGTLAFPAKDASGGPVLGSDVKAVELVVRDVAGVKERVLRWEVSR